MRTECLVQGDAATAIEGKLRFLQLASVRGWQEGIDRAIGVPPCTLDSLATQTLLRQEFTFESSEGSDGRTSETLLGEFELGASELEESLFKVSLAIRISRTWNLIVIQAETWRCCDP